MFLEEPVVVTPVVLSLHQLKILILSKLRRSNWESSMVDCYRVQIHGFQPSTHDLIIQKSMLGSWIKSQPRVSAYCRFT